MTRAILAVSVVLASTLPVHADEVTEVLTSATEAYTDGDYRYALEELSYAQQLINELRQSQLESFLPDAPADWTRQDGQTYSQPGAGMSVSAVYRGSNGQFNLAIMLDSPQAAQISSMLANAASLGGQTKIVRVGRTKFLDQGHQVSGVIDGRIVVQASGSDKTALMDAIESIDLRALADVQ